MNSVASNTLPSLILDNFEDLFHPPGHEALPMQWCEGTQYKIVTVLPTTLPERGDGQYPPFLPDGQESSTSESMCDDGLWTDLEQAALYGQILSQTPATMQYVPSTSAAITASQGNTYHQPSQDPQALLSCTWPSCTSTKVWSRHSDLKKHMDRHTRPYICKEDKCNKPPFGDKASLNRHTREVHGTTKHFCPFPSCQRNSTGYPRKRSLVAHMRTQHKGQSEGDDVMLSDQLQSSGFEAGEDGMNAGAVVEGIGGGKRPRSEMSCLYLELQEREAEKRELVLCLAKVDEEMLTLMKSAIRMVSN